MNIWWLSTNMPVEYNRDRHLAYARLALFWDVQGGVIAVFDRRGERECWTKARELLPRLLAGGPMFVGIADLTDPQRIDWRSYGYGFTTAPNLRPQITSVLL